MVVFISGCTCNTQEPCTDDNNCAVLFNNTGPEVIVVSAEMLSGIARSLATIGT
jgi:N-acetylmuramic acid 6-phosphate (MurNAc-6-P) etherase